MKMFNVKIMLNSPYYFYKNFTIFAFGFADSLLEEQSKHPKAFTN